MTEQDYHKLLDASVEELPREIKPPRDLWTGIDHAIELRAHDRRKWRSNKFLQAAAVAALVVGGSWFFSLDLGSNNTTSSEARLTTLAEDIDKGFKAKKANILAVYEGQPALTSTWQDQLRELEIARDDIWEALKENPNNVYMIQILMEVQQQQLDLIESVHTDVNQDI